MTQFSFLFVLFLIENWTFAFPELGAGFFGEEILLRAKRQSADSHDKVTSTDLCTEDQFQEFESDRDSEWKVYTESCYKFLSDSKSWTLAERDCVERGAHLVSIHSDEEKDFVNNLIGDSDLTDGQIWIGLKKDGNSWLWTDGSRFNYENWDRTRWEEPGRWKIWEEPDNSPLAYCTHTIDTAGQPTDDYTWVTNHCSARLRYICKKSSKGNKH